MKNPYLICFLGLVGYLSMIYAFSFAIGFVYFDVDNVYRQSADFVDGLSYIIVFGVLSFIFKKQLSLTLSQRGFFLGLMLGITLRLLVICINYLFGNSSYPEIGYRLFFSINVVLLIPVVEELFFRGIVLEKLKGSNISITKAVLFSSALFSLIHFDSGMITMIYALLTGIVLGVFYIKFGLASVIVVHVTDNLFWYLSRLIVPTLGI